MGRQRPYSDREVRTGRWVIRKMTSANVWLYRRSGGRLGGRVLGAPILLLNTIGRKSGQARTVPLLYLDDGEALVVVASNGGMPAHPLWFRNLEAAPRVSVEIRRRRIEVDARRATEEEKADYWPRLVKLYRYYDDYKARTPRNIPVVILSRPEGGRVF